MPDRDITTQLKRAAEVLASGRADEAIARIDEVARAVLRMLQTPAATEVSAVDNPLLSVSMYLSVARRDLVEGDVKAAKLSLGHAMTAWERRG